MAPNNYSRHITKNPGCNNRCIVGRSSNRNCSFNRRTMNKFSRNTPESYTAILRSNSTNLHYNSHYNSNDNFDYCSSRNYYN